MKRIVFAILGIAALAAIGFVASFSSYVQNSEGEPKNVLLAEWGRDHHLGPVVAKAEDFYYAHINKVPVGGSPTAVPGFNEVQSPAATTDPTPEPTQPRATASSQKSTPASNDPSTQASQTSSLSSNLDSLATTNLAPPATVDSPVSKKLKGEGAWVPVGSTVNGKPAIYVTRVRADNIHTSVFASLMWINTDLAKAVFVPGYIEPGGPSPTNGALSKSLQSRVLANFNGAFRLDDTRGGYYYKGTTVRPLVSGKATAVIYNDGSIKIGKWGRDVNMTKDVEIARQNLALIIDGGSSRVQSGNSFQWGATTHGETFAWRSAIGQRADGSIVYIGSPGLSAQGMANTMVNAGVKRAMVLDMNNWWVAGFYFRHASNGDPICAKLDPNIQEGCSRFLKRYKRDSFDFVARP